MDRPILVSVAGGTASGKTTLCRTIQEKLGLNCTLLEMDNFYRGLTPQQHEFAHEYNFDHPDAIDFNEALNVVQNLLNGNDVELAIYDFKTHSRSNQFKSLKSNKLILYEGIYSLYDERVRNLMQLKIFVQTDDDVRLCRRLLRDTKERGREVDGILTQYFKFVKPSFDEYIRPTMKYADIIVPNGASNQIAIDLIVKNLKTSLGI
jgi:uridine kinase